MLSPACSSSRLSNTKKNRTAVSSSLFSLLPEEIMIDEILLNLPMSSLLQLRCVSRYFRSLIKSGSFVRRYHGHNSTTNAQLLITCRRNYGRHRNKEVYKHYSCNFSSSIVNDQSLPEAIEMPCPFVESVGIYGSCNGLLFLHGTREEHKMHGYVWNPCTKEYKELPTPPSIDEHLFGGIEVKTFICNSKNMSSSGFCGFGYDRISGFGYDRISDEYKILYHENRVGHLPNDVIRKRSSLVSVTGFKLYTLGSDTWKNITDNPYKSLFFGCPWKNIGFLVNGALHWIMSSVPSSRLSSTSSLSRATNAKIISFDMEKEEFGEVQKPPCYSSSPEAEDEEYYYRELQVLQECLCLCQSPNKSNNRIHELVEIWMLKDYTVKDSWTKLFKIWIWVDLLAIKYLKLFPCCENGIIKLFQLIRLHDHPLTVHDVNKRSKCILIEKIDELTQNRWTHEVIHKESLVSLNSGTYTTIFG